MDKQQLPLDKGMFLLASPSNEQLVYKRSVVLVCEHSPAGSFGLIVNKPIQIEDDESAQITDEITSDQIDMRLGGPMQPTQMMLLHSSSQIPEQTLEITKGVYLGGDIDFLQNAIHEDNPPHLFLCLGYSGWLAGQLEQEIASGDWIISQSSPEKIFSSKPENLWQHLLRDLGGDYSSYSMIPDDLDLN